MPPAMFGVPASNLYGSDVVEGLLEGDRADHVAAALVRRHGLEEAGLAVQDADAGGAEQLVAGERVEVAIEVLDVDLAGEAPPAPHRPAPERRRRCAISMICLTGLIVPSAFDTCATATSFVLVAQEPLVLIDEQLAVVVDRDDAEHCAPSARRGSATGRCWSGAPSRR